MQKARGYDGTRQRMGREPCRVNSQYGKRALGKLPERPMHNHIVTFPAQ